MTLKEWPIILIQRLLLFLLGLGLCSMFNVILLEPAYANDGYECTHGFHTFGDKVLNGGVGDYGNSTRYYWCADNINDTHKSYAATAVKKWVKTTDDMGVTTSLSVKNTATKSKSSFDISKVSITDSGVLAETHFFLYSKEIKLNAKGALTKNYGYTKIYVDTKHCNNLLDSAAQRTATIGHEFGHAFGLSHQNTKPLSIMCQANFKRTATRANRADLKAINHLY